MRKYLIGLTALFALVATPSVVAVTGNDLLAQCKSSEVYKNALCIGIINGFVTGYWAGSRGGHFKATLNYKLKDLKLGESRTIMSPDEADEAMMQGNPYCPPEGRTAQQVQDIAVKYLENHPDTRHQNMVVLLPAAFFEAWPCKR